MNNFYILFSSISIYFQLLSCFQINNFKDFKKYSKQNDIFSSNDLIEKVDI